MFTRLLEDHITKLTASQVLLAAMAFACVLLFGASVLFLYEQRQRAVRKRLDMSGPMDVPATRTRAECPSA